MSISNQTRKLLWGRSGNRCAICRRELTMSGKDEDSDCVIGEECHIVAKKNDGPRGISDLNKKQRDEYENLILLCSIHHKKIDDQIENYSVKNLKTIKLHHERWVRNSLNAFDDIKNWKDESKENRDLLSITSVTQLPTMTGVYKAKKESDDSIITVAASYPGLGKNGKFFGSGWSFSITNNSNITIRVNKILADVQSIEKIYDIEPFPASMGGGGAKYNLYWCELIPETGLFECRYRSKEYDFVKIFGKDLEAFEIYFVDTSYQSLIYSIQIQIYFTIGPKEYNVKLEPISVSFVNP